jgi:hypothetical protein
MNINKVDHIKQSSSTRITLNHPNTNIDNTIKRVNDADTKPTNSNLNLDKTSTNNNINKSSINNIKSENRVNNINKTQNKPTSTNNDSGFCCIKISENGNICNRRKLIFFFLTLVVVLLIIGIACGLVFGLKQ